MQINPSNDFEADVLCVYVLSVLFDFGEDLNSIITGCLSIKESFRNKVLSLDTTKDDGPELRSSFIMEVNELFKNHSSLVTSKVATMSNELALLKDDAFRKNFFLVLLGAPIINVAKASFLLFYPNGLLHDSQAISEVENV